MDEFNKHLVDLTITVMKLLGNKSCDDEDVLASVMAELDDVIEDEDDLLNSYHSATLVLKGLRAAGGCATRARGSRGKSH